MRRAAKRDANEPEIVQALRDAGYTVTLWGIDGAPDLVITKSGQVWLREVKVPERKDGKGHAGKNGRGELTEAQVKWWDANPGAAEIVHGVIEALESVEAYPEADRLIKSVLGFREPGAIPEPEKPARAHRRRA
jgi:hypothetical protein